MTCICFNTKGCHSNPIIHRPGAQFRRKQFEWWNKYCNFVSTVHCLLIINLGIVAESNNFLFRDLHSLKCSVKNLFQHCPMGYFRVHMEEISNQMGNFVTQSIHFNKYFVGLEPINYRRGAGFVKLDVANGFQTAKNAADHCCLASFCIG